MNSEEISKSYAQNLWQLANILTGFSAAQILIVLLSLANDSTLRRTVNAHQLFTTVVTVVGQTILIAFVRWCNKRQLILLGGASASDEISHTIKIISYIQYFVLVVVAVGFLIFVWNIL